jgi:hypothetical protein
MKQELEKEKKLNIIEKLVFYVVLPIVLILLLIDILTPKMDNSGCPILDGNYNIIENRDCDFKEDYCKSINCTFTHWNCGRPACKCG